MTSTGSGVGGDLGTPQTPTPTALNATAWTAVNKQALGIVKDSLEMAFSTINQQHVWKYRASEENPMLDHPLETTRMATGTTTAPDESWRAEYARLRLGLPDIPQGFGVATRLAEELAKPAEERSGPYTVLDSLLVLTAKVLTRNALGAPSTDPSSVSFRRKMENITYPYGMLQSLVDRSGTTLQHIQNALSSIGANYPQFDQLQTISDRTSLAHQGFRQLLDLLKQDPEAAATKQYAAKLAEKMQGWNREVQGSYTGNDLTFLKASFQAMTDLSTALAVGDTSVPSLYLALAVASASTNESNPGIPGKDLISLSTTLNDALLNTIPPLDASHRLLFDKLTAIGLGLFAGLSGRLADPGYTTLSNQTPAYIADAKEFGFDSALHLLHGLGAVQGYFDSAGEAAGMDQKSAETLSNQLTSAAFLLMIAGANNKLPLPAIERLILSHSQVLLQGASFGEAALTETDIDPGNTKAQRGAIALQQLRMALELGDPEAALTAIDNLFGVADTSMQHVQNEIHEIKNAADLAISASGENPGDTLTTAIRVA